MAEEQQGLSMAVVAAEVRQQRVSKVALAVQGRGGQWLGLTMGSPQAAEEGTRCHHPEEEDAWW